MTWNTVINLPRLHHLSLMWFPIRLIPAVLSHLYVPLLESLNLQSSAMDEDLPKVQPTTYHRLTKLELQTSMSRRHPHIFKGLNSLIDNFLTRLEHLHFRIWSGVWETEEAQRLTNVAAIRTRKRVTLDQAYGGINMDHALSCLGESPSTEELVTTCAPCKLPSS